MSVSRWVRQSAPARSPAVIIQCRSRTVRRCHARRASTRSAGIRFTMSIVLLVSRSASAVPVSSKARGLQRPYVFKGPAAGGPPGSGVAGSTRDAPGGSDTPVPPLFAGKAMAQLLRWRGYPTPDAADGRRNGPAGLRNAMQGAEIVASCIPAERRGTGRSRRSPPVDGAFRPPIRNRSPGQSGSQPSGDPP